MATDAGALVSGRDLEGLTPDPIPFALYLEGEAHTLDQRRCT